jgi:uncharacterized protein YaiI (UPF0178 family)
MENAMKIWVDADACPAVIREILFRAAERAQIETTLVANHTLRTPPSRFIRSIRVEQGADVADHEILRRCEAGDLVITSDLPLAAEVIDKGAQVLTPRGEPLTANNVRSRLNMRDFLETLRASGIQSGGPAALNQSDRHAFARHLDTLIQRARR